MFLNILLIRRSKKELRRKAMLKLKEYKLHDI